MRRFLSSYDSDAPEYETKAEVEKKAPLLSTLPSPSAASEPGSSVEVVVHDPDNYMTANTSTFR